jgi:hypothetical protein
VRSDQMAQSSTQMTPIYRSRTCHAMGSRRPCRVAQGRRGHRPGRDATGSRLHRITRGRAPSSRGIPTRCPPGTSVRTQASGHGRRSTLSSHVRYRKCHRSKLFNEVGGCSSDTPARCAESGFRPREANPGRPHPVSPDTCLSGASLLESLAHAGALPETASARRRDDPGSQRSLAAGEGYQPPSRGRLGRSFDRSAHPS